MSCGRQMQSERKNDVPERFKLRKQIEEVQFLVHGHMSVCLSVCLCVFRDIFAFSLQKYFKALSVALFAGPGNVLQQEGNKEDRDESTEKKLRVRKEAVCKCFMG